MASSGIEGIQTARFTLDPLVSSDAAEMVRVLEHPDLYEYTGGEAPDLNALQHRYEAQTKGSGDPGERWFNWIIRTTEARQAVGFVQATDTDSETDVAWLVGVEFQGQGVATEAAKAMCDWFVRNGVRRITAHVHPLHVASQRVASAIGLAATGETDDDGEEVWALSTGPA